MTSSADSDRGRIEDLIEHSSLGTPEAKALRATVSDEQAARIVALAKELDSADSDAGCVECGNAVDRTLPDPIPEGYECMWSEAMTGKALYCLACYSDTTPELGAS